MRYWDVFYTNSQRRTLPFRHDTRITNSSRDSLHPAIGVDRDGNRVISWHEQMGDKYQILGAKGDGDRACSRHCDLKNLDILADSLNFCQLSFDFCTDLCELYDEQAFELLPTFISLLTNGGFEADGGVVSQPQSWSADDYDGAIPHVGPGVPFFPTASSAQTGTAANEGTWYAGYGGYIQGGIIQDNSVTAYADDIDAGVGEVDLSVWVFALAESGGDGDNHRVIVRFFDELSAELSVDDSNWFPNSGPEVGAWDEYAKTIDVPVGTRTVRLGLYNNRSYSAFMNAYFDNCELTLVLNRA